MHIVRESINFTRGLEPKNAMSTGLLAHLPELIFQEDKKYSFITGPGNIMSIQVTPTRLLIKFFHNKLKNPETNKIVSKKVYAEKLINDLNIQNIFINSDFDYRSQTAIYRIKEEYRSQVKRGEYHP